MIALRSGDGHAAADYMWRCRGEVAGQQVPFRSSACRWGEYLATAVHLTPDRAARLLTTDYPDVLESPGLLIEDPAAAPWLARLAVAAGDALLATSIVTAAERLAALSPGWQAADVIARHARAVLRRDAGTLEYVAGEHQDAWAAKLASEDALAARAARPAAARPGPRAAGGSQKGPVRSPAQAREMAGQPDGLRPEEENCPVSLPPGVRMTAIEEQVMRLAAEGMTNRQIARAISRSPHTVNYHLRRIFRKLNLRSRVELAKYVYGRG